MSSSSFLNSRRSNHGRTNAESRLGLPRPSLGSMRTTNSRKGRTASQPPQSEAETDYDSYYDEDEDELEAEALLSKRHGEAAEAGAPKNGNAKDSKKRGSTDQDIADEYAEQEKERKKKARRKVKRTITPDDLVKSKGLTVVRNGITARFHSGGVDGKAEYVNTTRSMAKYSRRLVNAYSDWVENMTGGMTLYETQWKLRSLGSKTQVKQYLNDMRKSVRDDYLERVLGLEKAERLLRQLEDYYNEEQEQCMEAVEEEEETEVGGEKMDRSSPVVTNPYFNNNNSSSSSNEAPSTDDKAPSVAVTPSEPANVRQNDLERVDARIEKPQKGPQKEKEEDPLLRRLRLLKELRARRHVLEDSDDEDEAVFEDIVPASTAKNELNVDSNKVDNSSTFPARSQTTKIARRQVLDDSDDSDDSDGEIDSNNATDEMEEAKEDAATAKNSDKPTGEDAANTKMIDQQDESDDTDDGFTKDSDVAATSNNASISELDGKFQKVKSLLEDGGRTHVSATSISEDTAESTDALTKTRQSITSQPVDKDEGANQKERILPVPDS